MQQTQDTFAKIQGSGGIFIVFIRDRRQFDYTIGLRTSAGLRDEVPITSSDWSFLRDLDSFRSSSSYGNEITFEEDAKDVGRTLTKGMDGAHFHATLEPHHSDGNRWISLARNKYGEPVAGILLDSEGRPSVILLPEMPNSHQCMVELLEKWCVRWNPRLFPYHEAAKWVHEPKYEIPKVLALADEIKRVQQDANAEIDRISQAIAREREANADDYILVQGTGDALVKAVIRILKRLFQN